jgi:hypothetical protein
MISVDIFRHVLEISESMKSVTLTCATCNCKVPSHLFTEHETGKKHKVNIHLVCFY